MPAEVRYDRDLKPNEKILFSEILALSSKKGYCFASNKHLADLMNAKTGTISMWLNNLEKKKFIKIKNDKERHIYIKKDLRYLSNSYSIFIEEGYDKNRKGIRYLSKYINNIINNKLLNIYKLGSGSSKKTEIESDRAYLKYNKKEIEEMLNED